MPENTKTSSPSAAKGAKKYVVAHDNLDDYRRGDIIDGETLDNRGVDVTRLLRLGAITELKHGEDGTGNRFLALSEADDPNVDIAGAPLDPGQSLDPTVTRPTSREIEARLATSDEEIRSRAEAAKSRGAERAANPSTPEEIAAGQAREPAQPAQPTQPAPSSPSAFDRMTVQTLQEIAAQHGIEGTSSMKKAELIAAIEKAQQEP